MLKKLVFVGALLLITNASYAALPTSGFDSSRVHVEEWDGNANIKSESWNWPAEYKYQAVCRIPVKMDVGFWVRIVGCKDHVLKLRQDSIRKYSGTITVTVQCNVSIDLAVEFTKLAGMPVSTDFVNINPTSLQPTGGDVTISLGLKDVDLAGFQSSAVGTMIEVGGVTIKVRPNVAPQLAGA